MRKQNEQQPEASNVNEKPSLITIKRQPTTRQRIYRHAHTLTPFLLSVRLVVAFVVLAAAAFFVFIAFDSLSLCVFASSFFTFVRRLWLSALAPKPKFLARAQRTHET